MFFILAGTICFPELSKLSKNRIHGNTSNKHKSKPHINETLFHTQIKVYRNNGQEERGKQSTTNPSASVEPPQTIQSCFRQGFGLTFFVSGGSAWLILVSAATYQQLCHLLPTDVGDALAGHDVLEDVRAQQGLGAVLAAAALHGAVEHHLAPVLVVLGQMHVQAAASRETRVTSCHKVSPMSQTFEQ